MGYAKKTAVWLVVLASLAWLTAAAANAGSGDTKTKDQGSKNKKDGSTGPTGSTGPSGATGPQGNGNGQSNGNVGQPETGVSMGAEPTGDVKVKLPGATKAVSLDGSEMLPIGTVVNAHKGKIKLTTALDADGHTQTATFWGGTFRVGQHDGYTVIVLAGRRPSCATAGKAQIARRKRKRGLWAQDNHGRYQTRGQNSVATVRGTEWLTVDRCDGTLTRVTRGAVVVKDRHTHRAVVVRAGHSYLARSRHSG